MTTENVMLSGGPHDGQIRTHDTSESLVVIGRNHYRRSDTDPLVYHHDPQVRQAPRVPISDDPEMIAKAAMMYRAAGLAGLSPTKTVAASLEIGIATAGRLARKARAKGLLPPAQQGRANFTDSSHRPRHARWSDASESWQACVACREPWPCSEAIAENSEGLT